MQLSNNSLKHLSTVHPRLQLVAKRAIEITRVDFGVSSGLRTAEEQHQLFLKGKSQLDGFIKESYHQTGRAIDVFAYVDGKANYEPVHLAQVAAAMLQAASELGVSLEWGGLWKNFLDMPHFQLGE